MLASDLFANARSGEAWWEARALYFQKSLCRPADGVFQSAYRQAHNQGNVIPRETAAFDQLIHAASLGSILWRLSTRGQADFDWRGEIEARTGSMPPERRQGAWSWAVFNAEVSAFAEKMISADVVRAVAAILCRALGDSQPPWFACFAEEVRDLVESADCSRLCERLGLGHFERGEWILLWRYDARIAQPLYRPTVVEANDSPYHYPSPPGCPFGVTMPLSSGLPACREVIHAPLHSPWTAECCLGRLYRVERELRIDHTGLERLRLSHAERLAEEFGSGAVEWKERHGPLDTDS